MKKILIVEDQSLVALDLSEIIQTFGYEVVGIASNYENALKIVFTTIPDLVLMDIYLENSLDGIAIATEIKRNFDIPIIYITALNSEEDIKRAIKTNPSAYLVKPFDVVSIKAAIEIAFISKNTNAHFQKGTIIFDEEFSFDETTNQLFYKNEFVKLTKKESELLTLLIKSINAVVSLYEIENNIWPDKDFNINTVRALVSRLRMKLKYKFIETISSIGYRLSI